MVYTSFAAVWFGASGCVQRFETPSAYGEQPYLCDPADADAYQERVENCRDAPDTCGGVMSMEGVLQGEDLRITAELPASVFRFFEASNGVVDLDSVDASGSSPYFNFTVQLASVGEIFTTDRMLVLDRAASLADDDLRDDAVAMSLRLNTAGESVVLAGATDSGTVMIHEQLGNELSADFAGEFGEDRDELTGCFTFFALDLRIAGD